MEHLQYHKRNRSQLPNAKNRFGPQTHLSQERQVNYGIPAFRIISYRLVNTIRHQLKANGINSCWTEIVRIGSTQKMITITGQNHQDEIISVPQMQPANRTTQRNL